MIKKTPVAQLLQPAESSRYDLSSYERSALDAIRAWKTPTASWPDQWIAHAKVPISKLAKALATVPGYQQIAQYGNSGKDVLFGVMHKSVGGLISVLNDAAHWSVRPKSIYADFQKLGHSVQSKDDILRLDLEEVDRALGWLSAKYKSLALTEGAAAGSVGAVGIAPDIVAIITLNLRAIGEYATYCGFDLTSRQERLFALNVLSLASSPDDAQKHVALAQLIRISNDVARNASWTKLNEHIFVKIVRSIAEQLGIRLTKAKLAQVVPIAGAAIGGGFNAYYTGKVCDSAFFLYRERFLAAKYGPDVIAQTVEPATELTVESEEPSHNAQNET